MSTGGENAVEPGLFVLVAGGSESCTGELFSIETVRWFLWRIAVSRESSYTTQLDSLSEMLVYEVPSTASVSW